MFLTMEEIKKTDDIQEDVTEEVVADTAESEDSSSETGVEDTSPESVETEETETEEVEDNSEDETEEGESSLKEDSEETVPFNKNPKFQERVKEIETKYGKKAQLWDTLAKLSNSDPEFQLELTRRLEAAGELPKGTYEMAKQKVETQGVEKQDNNKEPDELEEKVSKLPEVQFARDLMRKKQEEEAAEEARIEGVLRDFESRHTDIASSEKPKVVRKRIATLAEGYVEEGMKYEDALEEAYTILFDKDSLLAQEREKGEVEGQIKAGIKSVAGASAGSQKPSKMPLRKLTREEEEARVMLGYSKEEYIRFKDSDGSVE